MVDKSMDGKEDIENVEQNVRPEDEVDEMQESIFDESGDIIPTSGEDYMVQQSRAQRLKLAKEVFKKALSGIKKYYIDCNKLRILVKNKELLRVPRNIKNGTNT